MMRPQRRPNSKFLSGSRAVVCIVLKSSYLRVSGHARGVVRVLQLHAAQPPHIFLARRSQRHLRLRWRNFLCTPSTSQKLNIVDLCTLIQHPSQSLHACRSVFCRRVKESVDMKEPEGRRLTKSGESDIKKANPTVSSRRQRLDLPVPEDKSYRLHFSCENKGRYFRSSKRRIRW
jgi:hypothetical protein